MPSIDEPDCQEVFKFADLVSWYEEHALNDSRIKEFAEKITEKVRIQEHLELIHSF